MPGMTRDPSPTGSRRGVLRRPLPRPHRPDLARWPEVAVHGAVGAVSMFALSAGLLTVGARVMARLPLVPRESLRSEERTSELQSRFDLVCRLLLEKKRKDYTT